MTKLEESREMHGTKGPGGKQIWAAAWNAHSSNQTTGCTQDALKELSEITLKQLESKLWWYLCSVVSVCSFFWANATTLTYKAWSAFYWVNITPRICGMLECGVGFCLQRYKVETVFTLVPFKWCWFGLGFIIPWWWIRTYDTSGTCFAIKTNSPVLPEGEVSQLSGARH